MPGRATVLVCLFAKEKKYWQESFEIFVRLFKKNVTGKEIVFEAADKKRFRGQIKKADVIILQGGDTLKLLKALKKFRGFTKAIKGKIVVGSSAGAYVLSAYFYGNSTDAVYQGLGIVPFRTRCHYKGEISKIKEKFSQFPESLKYKLVLLKDFEHKVYKI